MGREGDSGRATRARLMCQSLSQNPALWDNLASIGQSERLRNLF